MANDRGNNAKESVFRPYLNISRDDRVVIDLRDFIGDIRAGLAKAADDLS
jgi:hypothetical protein